MSRSFQSRNVLHAPGGGLLLYYLTGKGMAYEAALPVAIIAVLCIAYLILVRRTAGATTRTSHRGAIQNTPLQACWFRVN